VAFAPWGADEAPRQVVLIEAAEQNRPEVDLPAAILGRRGEARGVVERPRRRSSRRPRAVATAAGEWTLVLTAFAPGETFEYQCLRDDATWQTGANVVGTGGGDNEVMPGC
jgi:hypothetical protein